MMKAYFTEINPTREQAIKMNQTIGVCRYVYNLFISRNKEVYEEEKRYVDGYEFSKWLNNEHTKEKDEWIKQVSSKAVKQAIMNADKAYKRFFKGISEFPKYKKKKKQDVKCYFPKNNKTDWGIERHRLKIPTLGWVRLKEYGYIPSNEVVKSGTISQKAGRYFVSVLCEVQQNQKKEYTVQNPNNKGIGIDLGIKDFAVCSNGKVYKNINKTSKIKKLEKKLRREQRSLSRKYENIKKRGEEPATKKRANINKNINRVRKQHARLANIRLEYTKYVVKEVAKTKPPYITIENLNVKGMMKNKHLSKAIAGQCFYTFKIWLQNKCAENQIELREVNRFYPSSKKCSSCGKKKIDLKLSDRVYECECGNKMDRDMNAALNLLQAKEYTVIA